jgi:hypothetical protein
MKYFLSLILFLVFASAFTLAVSAQEAASGAEAAADLHTQLLHVQAQEAALQTAERELDEALKPENIERSLAGVGSTRPEELRELRRRQLTIERDSVRRQLEIVGTSRERLESALRSAEARAYQESAEGTTPVTQTLMAYAGHSPVWLVGVIAALDLIAIIGIAVVMIRRRSTI